MNGPATTRPRTTEEPGAISDRWGGFPITPYTLGGRRRNEVWFGNELIIRHGDAAAALHLCTQLNRAFKRGAREMLAHLDACRAVEADSAPTEPEATSQPTRLDLPRPDYTGMQGFFRALLAAARSGPTPACLVNLGPGGDFTHPLGTNLDTRG